MNCPSCGGRLRVIRTIQLCGKIIRIRKCLVCRREISTTEKIS